MLTDSADRRPLYAQVEDHLANRIADGSWPVGSRLPSEDELIERFAVSRTTIRTTVQNLARRGLVEIRRGKGTYVTETKLTQPLTELSGFVEDMQAAGRHASARVVSHEVVHASAEVAHQLALPAGTEVVRIKRVRLADGIPLSLDDTFLPRALGDQILANDLATEPIFALLEQKYATPLIEAEYRLDAIVADVEIAAALEVSAGSAIFRIERTSYTTGHRPVDYEQLHYRGDRIRFATRLLRNPPDRPRAR
jgi:GntR family transcriptional regulator